MFGSDNDPVMIGDSITLTCLSSPGSAHNPPRGGARGQEAECRPESPDQALL